MPDFNLSALSQSEPEKSRFNLSALGTTDPEQGFAEPIFMSDPAPGAARPAEAGVGSIPNKVERSPHRFSESVASFFGDAGLAPVGSDEAKDRFGGPIKAAADNLGTGIVRLPAELAAGLADNPVEFAKSLLDFVPDVANVAAQATFGGKITDASGKKPFKLSNLSFDGGFPINLATASDEEVAIAREEALKNPLMFFLAAMAAGKGVSPSLIKANIGARLAAGKAKTVVGRAKRSVTDIGNRPKTRTLEGDFSIVEKAESVPRETPKVNLREILEERLPEKKVAIKPVSAEKPQISQVEPFDLSAIDKPAPRTQGKNVPQEVVDRVNAVERERLKSGEIRHSVRELDPFKATEKEIADADARAHKLALTTEQNRHISNINEVKTLLKNEKMEPGKRKALESSLDREQKKFDQSLNAEQRDSRLVEEHLRKTEAPINTNVATGKPKPIKTGKLPVKLPKPKPAAKPKVDTPTFKEGQKVQIQLPIHKKPRTATVMAIVGDKAIVEFTGQQRQGKTGSAKNRTVTVTKTATIRLSELQPTARQAARRQFESKFEGLDKTERVQAKRDAREFEKLVDQNSKEFLSESELSDIHSQFGSASAGNKAAVDLAIENAGKALRIKEDIFEPTTQAGALPALKNALKNPNELKNQIERFRKADKTISGTLADYEISAFKRVDVRARKRGTELRSGLRPEDFADLGDFVIIGAAKVARGAIEFGRFSAEMVKEFGEHIKPHLQQIFDEAVRYKTTIASELLTKNNARPKQSTINTINKTFTEFVDRTPATFKSSGKIDLKNRVRKEGVTVLENEPTIDGQRISTFKDLKALPASFNTFPRIMRNILGKERADRMFIDGFDNAKGAMVDMSMRLLEDLETSIEAPVRKGGLGIPEKSKLSRKTQEFGEQLITYDKLVKDVGKEKADRVVKATAWFREKYDVLLDEVNGVLEIIYPNQPHKLIPKRVDYFRHFQELNEGFRALRDIVETPSEIAPSMAGISAFTRPMMKFLSIAQRRSGGKYRLDAVGGFKEYIPQATYTMKITPQIKNLRNFARELRNASQLYVDQTGKAPPLNRYTEYIDRMANQLAGKKGAWDRAFLEVVPGGRTSLNVLAWVNRRAAANAILGNVGALVVSMPANIVNAAGKLKLDLARGATSSIVSLFDKNHPIRRSRHWREVDLPLQFNKFNRRWLQDPIKNSGRFLGWTIDVSNKIAGFPIWNAAYNRALRQGIKDPMRFADNMTRDLMGGRGIGEKPLAFTQETTKIFLNFQLEVTNAWYVLKDLVSERDFAGLTTAMIAAWAYNQMAEKIRGNGVVFDPIDAIVDGVDTFNDPNSDSNVGTRLLKASGRVGGEVLSNLPLGQFAAAAYPEGGIEGLPTRKELFGDNDPTRFGTGVLVQKAISDPLFSLLTPFGGQQIKKTVGGLKSLKEGEVHSRSGKTQKFRVSNDFETQMKAILFGKWATPEAKSYFERQDESRKKNTAQDAIKASIARGDATDARRRVVTWNRTHLRDKIDISKMFKSVQRAKMKESGQTKVSRRRKR